MGAGNNHWHFAGAPKTEKEDAFRSHFCRKRRVGLHLERSANEFEQSVPKPINQSMKKIPDLNFGFNDAENYRRRENKQLFNQLFIKTAALNKLCSRESFFLIGEKGYGKTAYSVFLSNNDYLSTRGRINYIEKPIIGISSP